jgi:hypothetical protein
LFKKTILVLKYFKYPRPRNSQHEANWFKFQISNFKMFIG